MQSRGWRVVHVRASDRPQREQVILPLWVGALWGGSEGFLCLAVWSLT